MVTVLAHMQVLDPGFRLAGVGLHTLPQRVEALSIKRSIYAAPVDRVFTRWFSDHKPVRGRAPGARPRFYPQRPGV